ncbi:MAG: hypothetical protein ABI597_12395 [Gammaproteobacteria bacterium]
MFSPKKPAFLQKQRRLSDCQNLAHVVCELAEKGGREKLRKFAAEHYCVDIVGLAGVTPCGVLAAQNKQEAVFLLINEFNACINAALYGAAYGNHPDLVKLLFKAGAEHGAALQGAARRGHVNLVTTLKELGKYFNPRLIETSAALGNCLTLFVASEEKSVLPSSDINRWVAQGIELEKNMRMLIS